MNVKKIIVLLLVGVITMSLFFGFRDPEKSTQGETGVIYKNENAGWQITIPESWEGYYRVIQNEDGAIDFYFYGHSEFSRNDLYSNDFNGLYFFSITENVPIGGDFINYSKVQWINMFYADHDPDASRKKNLGEVDGVEYYIAQRVSHIYSQEYDWGSGGIYRLLRIDDEGSHINYKTRERETLEPDEFELVKIDISRVKEMGVDLVNEVRLSFEPIKE